MLTNTLRYGHKISANLLPLVYHTQKMMMSTEVDSTNKKQSNTKEKKPRNPPKVKLTDEELSASAEANKNAVNSVRHTLYSNNRSDDFAQYAEKYPGWTPYSDVVEPSITFDEYRSSFHDIEDGSRRPDLGTHVLCGRINSKRDASKQLFFLDIRGHGDNLTQVPIQAIISSRNMVSEGFELSHILKKGDWVAVTGFPGKSNTGELSIVTTNVQLLTPCLQNIPEKLIDPNLRFRNRSLDLIVNHNHTWDIFRIRTQMFATLRKFFTNKGFTEVETPVLWNVAGGATARPFITTSNAFGNDMQLNLRIAPELFLKQLVIGGMERVFEVSKVFRNEGIDATHNPEFTTCEMYMAHADYKTMMRMTEDLLREIVLTTTGSHVISLPTGPAEPHLGVSSVHHTLDLENAQTNGLTYIDFSPSFATLDVVDTLRDNGINLPENFNDPESIPELMSICKERGWSVGAPYTNARILDKMISEVIEPMCIQPTFIINQPVCLSPLAKLHRNNPNITERFELFIAGKEYANAYSELNIPSEQYNRLSQQQKLKTASGENNDEEAHPLDTPYCEALEYGLPPTGGWGLGLDRLAMLLARVPHIRDVIFFPIMKPEHPCPHSKTAEDNIKTQEDQ